MDQDELDREILECARYDEFEELEEYLKAGANVNYQEEGTGNTALHKASANGNIECIKVLLRYGALYVPNNEKNTPLHWAALNAKNDIIKLIFDHYSDTIDVLAQNSFGRSIMTEAFTSNNSDTIELCLSHQSATEERLIPSGNRADVKTNIDDDDESQEMDGAAAADDAAVTHCMMFNNNIQVDIRELPITRADNPFGTEERPQDDTTGLGIWPASIIASRYLLSKSHLYHGKVVVELGAGCGLPSFACALDSTTPPSIVYCTDIHANTLNNCLFNLRTNVNRTVPSVFSTIDNSLPSINSQYPIQNSRMSINKVVWNDPSTYPDDKADVIIGSDLVYDRNILTVLVPTIKDMLNANGSFLYVAPMEGRAGMDMLYDTLVDNGFTCREFGLCPDELYSNPLHDNRSDDAKNVDVDDLFILHFYDLSTKKPHYLFWFTL